MLSKALSYSTVKLCQKDYYARYSCDISFMNVWVLGWSLILHEILMYGMEHLWHIINQEWVGLLHVETGV